MWRAETQIYELFSYRGGWTVMREKWRKVYLKHLPLSVLSQKLKEIVIAKLCIDQEDAHEIDKLTHAIELNRCAERYSHSKLLSALFRFVTFENVESVKLFGDMSANGFVSHIKYEKNIGTLMLQSCAVLKSSRKRSADNLIYEYLAGQYVNSICNILPCFVQTYGLYKYTDDAWRKAQLHSATPEDLKENLKSKKLQLICDESKACNVKQIQNICKDSKLFAILIQNVSNPISLQEYIMLKECTAYDLTCILFILYMALDKLKDEFTHYDLHAGNCLVCAPYDKPIRYIYHLDDDPDGETIEFYTKYMPKIIDYGRSFFHGNEAFTRSLKKGGRYSIEKIENMVRKELRDMILNRFIKEETNGKEVVKELSDRLRTKYKIYKQHYSRNLLSDTVINFSKTRNTNTDDTPTFPDCHELDYEYERGEYAGDDSGFTWLTNCRQDTDGDHHICTNKRNASHDLRLLHVLDEHNTGIISSILNYDEVEWELLQDYKYYNIRTHNTAQTPDSGWAFKKSRSGQGTYYINTNTRIKQWEHPYRYKISFKDFGVAENTESGIENKTINNVSDAHECLQKKILSSTMKKPEHVALEVHVYYSNKKIKLEEKQLEKDLDEESVTEKSCNEWGKTYHTQCKNGIRPECVWDSSRAPGKKCHRQKISKCT